jgi:hypothetical protein
MHRWKRKGAPVGSSARLRRLHQPAERYGVFRLLVLRVPFALFAFEVELAL